MTQVVLILNKNNLNKNLHLRHPPRWILSVVEIDLAIQLVHQIHPLLLVICLVTMVICLVTMEGFLL